MISNEMILEIAERYGIEVKKVEQGKGGLFCDGKRISGEEIEKIVLTSFEYQNISSPAFNFTKFNAQESNYLAA